MSRNRGFSLTEVLLSITLLTIMSLGLMSTFSYLKRGTLRQGDNILVNSLMEQRMTELKVAYTKDGTLKEVAAADPEAIVADFPIGINPKLTVVGERKDGGVASIPGGLRLVTVSLDWDDKKGVHHLAKTKSFFYKE